MSNFFESLGGFYEDYLKSIADVATGGALSQRDAAKEQRKAARVQQRLQAAKASRERRAQIREAISAQAQVQAGAEVSGATRTSAAAGGVGSVTTQLASNLSFLNTQEQAAGSISRYNQRAADLFSQAQTSRAIRNTVVQGASIFAGGA